MGSLQSPRMEPPSPARLFASLAGAGLLIYGIVGFFYGSSFGGPDDLREALGLLSVNGWANSFHVLTGAIGLLLAGFASWRYALWLTVVYVAVAVFGSLV
jgi:Domain of unknown function (DUF4383)